MNSKSITAAALSCMLFAGCSTSVRSISRSTYEAPHYAGATVQNRELRELDVLGIDPENPVTEDAIQKAMQGAGRVALRPGGTVMLVQSGAEYPDAAMVEGMSQRFRVVPFTGLAQVKDSDVRRTKVTGHHRSSIIFTDPYGAATVVPMDSHPRYETYTTATETPVATPGGYSRLLRLAAARAGAETIICYWGVLESAESNNIGKPVAWVPVMNWVLPDRREHMRIRLKVALVDVRSGNWTLFSPEAFEGKKSTTRWTRESGDQKLAEALKLEAYEACVKQLGSYTGVALR